MTLKNALESDTYFLEHSRTRRQQHVLTQASRVTPGCVQQHTKWYCSRASQQQLHVGMTLTALVGPWQQQLQIAMILTILVEAGCYCRSSTAHDDYNVDPASSVDKLSSQWT